ncbi:MAG: NAD-dependent epimerase/dehydratase family protein [Clostridia bacterium]|jgi:dihydroflavonol-4-reductase|nr:NAD-dependent epimerase/dehydratase family protein [Clostridia bacterium]MBT7121550.1 NAD-dependent epimerase/dehydratase family protein [Clostridia bacterium]
MILITGAGGHIGNVLVKHLYRKGHRDLRLFVQPKEDISYIEKYASEVIRGDIRDSFAVSAAVRGCDNVFHLAGLVQISGVNKKLVMDVNVGGTINVINACLEKKVDRLLHVSSVHALKEPEVGQIDETLDSDISHLNGAYAQSKAMATIEVMNAIQKGLNAVIVFPSGVIGPYDFRSSYTGSAIKGYISASKTQYYFDGKYDFVDVRDVVDGIYRAWKAGEKGQGYIISGSISSLEEIIEAVEDTTGNTVKRKRVPAFLVRVAAFFAPIYYKIARKKPVLSKYSIDVLMGNANISSFKAESKLGYRARPLIKTIRDMVRWHKAAKIHS